MANVSKIVLPDGTECDIKDKTARELLLKTSKIITGTCSTGAGQTALVATIPDYTLADNDILAITFANDVPAGATLNVNGTGAKAIQVNGAAIDSGIIKAKSIALLLYGAAITLIETSSTASDVGGHTIQSDVPANAKFTDTTYEDATQSAHGLMTASDKSKLDGIATMTGASAKAAGKGGLVPAPAKGEQEKFLRGDGSWAVPTDTKYTLPTASSSTLGGVQTTSTVTNVTGWTATPIVDGVPYFYDHTYSIMTAATASANGKYGLVPSPAAGKQNSFLRGDGTWADVTASDCLPLAGGTMTGTIKSDAQYPVIVNNGDSRTYGFPLRVNKSDGTAMCNIATQHTDALNALLFQIYEPNDSSKYAYFNIYADPSTGYRMATNCTMPKNYTAGTVSYNNKVTTVTLGYKPSAVLLYTEAAYTGGWAVMGLNASRLTATGFTIPPNEADINSAYAFTLKNGSYAVFLGPTVHYIAFK